MTAWTGATKGRKTNSKAIQTAQTFFMADLPPDNRQIIRAAVTNRLVKREGVWSHYHYTPNHLKRFRQNNACAILSRLDG